jgi:hypothetical protein
VSLRTAGGISCLPVLRVVISGFASRHNLPVDRLDDVQLAVETLVAEEKDTESEIVLEMAASTDGLIVRVGGLRNQSVRTTLLAVTPFESCADCPLDVRLLLGSLVDSFSVLDSGPACFAVEMEQRVS